MMAQNPMMPENPMPMTQVVLIDSKGRAVTHVVHLKKPADEVMWIDQSNAGTVVDYLRQT